MVCLQGVAVQVELLQPRQQHERGEGVLGLTQLVEGQVDEAEVREAGDYGLYGRDAVLLQVERFQGWQVWQLRQDPNPANAALWSGEELASVQRCGRRVAVA